MNIELMPHDHGNVQRAAALHKELRRGGSFDTVAEIFRLLDDGSRVRIFWLLCHCEECVLNISALTEMSSPAASHHLRLLKDAGLVETRREGKEVYYRAADTPVVKLLHSMIEKTMEISCPEIGESADTAPGFTAEQVETVRRMHDELLQHPEQRPTIEELARRCLMNPTTLKAVFKAVYGDSLAAHMKEHRLEKGAELLRRSDESVADIAAAVGYDSASRFSAAFRDRFHMLPTEYRKQLK
jgi:AraC-like DNA-binding protein